MAKKPRSGSPRQESRGPFDGRVRVAALALIALLVVMAFWARPKKAPASPKAAEESELAATERSGTSFMGGAIAPAPSGAPTAPAKAPDPPPVIDEIDVEKSEVCAGEENLISIKAHTVNGTDEFLHYTIDGHMGESVPITLWTDNESGQVLGTHTVTVFGRGNVATTQPLPSYTVKNCRPTYIAGIQQRLRSNTWSDFDFNARVVGVPPAPTEADKKRGAPPRGVPKAFKAIAYSWTFGDGESEVTMGPIVHHDYEGRAQTTLYSYYVVGVTIRGANKDEVATGRITLPLINPAFESLKEKKIVQLMISLDPRFPEIGSDGKVTQHVRIWHAQPGPVTIERATLVKYYRRAAGETPPQQVDVGSLLGTASIPPGKDGITVTVTLDPESEEEVFSKTWSLDGADSDGNRASGAFSVMLPPPKPSADAGTTVFDPIMKQKILLARDLLGKDVVDDEDLWALERQGAFANIKADPGAIIAARQQANAAMLARGYPSPQPAYVEPGPPVPKTTSEQLAPPNQGASTPSTSK